MATQNPTANYEWVLPTVGASADAWGTIINALIGDDATGIDAIVKAVSDVANAALPKAGGAMTGALQIDTISERTAASGVTIDGLLVKDGAIPATGVPTLDAAKIGTGTLDPARIPTLDAAKIGTGTFADARIASSNVTQHQAALAIAATQLTGTIASARIAGAYTGITGLGTLASDLLTSANIGRNTLDGVLIISGGDVGGAQGDASANIRLTGKNHATTPNRIEFRVNTTLKGYISLNSTGTFQWDGVLSVGAASVFASTVTASSFIKSA